MIWTAISAVIPWDLLAWAAGGLAALWGVWFAGKRSNAVRAENKGLRATIETMETRNEVDNRIASERDARSRLRSDWSE